MSDSFNLEIVNPEKLFLSLDNVSEVVVPAFEGDMGILKDHISIISFLKPGIVKVFTGNEVKELYVEDGICLLYTSPSPRDYAASRMPSSA